MEFSDREQKITYSLKIRPWKRGLTLRVGPDGATVVSSGSARKRDIEDFVRKNADWIIRKQDYFRGFLSAHPPKEFVSGECFPVLGRQYRLEIVKNLFVEKPICQIIEGILRATIGQGSQENLRQVVRRALMEFYFKVTQGSVEENVLRYGPALGVSAQKIRIAHQKSRWGSCSPKGNLSINWRLAMAPPLVLEYVVVHELCHLKHLNHSERFWRALESLLPNYRVQKKWLRENGLALSLAFEIGPGHSRDYSAHPDFPAATLAGSGGP